VTFRTKAVLAVLGGFALAFAVPGLAAACDNCIAAQSDSVQRAFVVASIFLSVTPLTLVGGGVWWFRSLVKQRQAEEEAGVTHLPAAPRPSRR
jgi:hypothetical protein